MKVSGTRLACLAFMLAVFLIVAPPSPAQRFPTNTINAAQAMMFASRLQVGMPEQQVAGILDGQNGLCSGGDIGDSFGWDRFYLLADGCFLDLQMEPKEFRKDGSWGNGYLRSASIQSNGVVWKVISLNLTGAPQLSGPTPPSQPVQSQTNRVSERMEPKQKQ